VALPDGTTVFDTYPPAVFNGIKFPVEKSRIEGGLRDYVHEYPHSPGGSPEKLGRSLYQFHITANFDSNFEAYPNLYPLNLDALLGYFEQGTTATDFRLPQMPSSVPAYARKWTREMSNRIRSGESVEFSLIEDQSTQFLFLDVVNLIPNVQAANNALSAALAQAVLQYQKDQLVLGSATGLFTSLTATVNKILAFRDQSILYSQAALSSVDALITTCQKLDESPSLQSAQAAHIMSALHDLWRAAVDVSHDIQSKGAQLQVWVVPTSMSVASVAGAIFGDSARASDLLSLNPFPDPMSIPAGYKVNYYPTR
jgi:prophage DNA circulation protein